jgi:hypothetical protein
VGKTYAQGGVAAIGLLVGAFLWAQVPACQIAGGYQAFSPHPCNVLPASKLDDKGLATLVLSKQTDGSCYWIDKTEVTVGQYAQFVSQFAQDGQAPPWGMHCSWKGAPSDPANDTSDACSGLALSKEADPFNQGKPIRCVDWCDAQAYCQWAGMQLCGSNANGGVFDPSDTLDLWGDACSENGLPYPNGVSPVLDQCNVGLEEAGECRSVLGQNNCGPTYADSFPGCAAQPSGALNMIGNVAEWVILCAFSDGGPDTQCQHRGGSFADTLQGATCTAIGSDVRSARDRTLGLRCCTTLNADEKNLVGR